MLEVTHSDTLFPTEDELISIPTDKTLHEPLQFVPNQLVVVLWDETEGERKWYVGFISVISDVLIVVYTIHSTNILMSRGSVLALKISNR